MRKLHTFFILLVSCAIVNAQLLTGTKIIPDDYSMIAAAIADLNTQGVGAGGVVFNVDARQYLLTGTADDGFSKTLRLIKQ